MAAVLPFKLAKVALLLKKGYYIQFWEDHWWIVMVISIKGKARKLRLIEEIQNWMWALKCWKEKAEGWRMYEK
jgi:hypothetical protein